MAIMVDTITTWEGPGMQEVPAPELGFSELLQLNTRVTLEQCKQLGWQVLKLSPIFGAIASAATFGIANHLETKTTLGAHTVAIAPTFDQHVTADLTGILTARIPVETPLNIGANITLLGTEDLETTIQRDALIASDPQGEIDTVHRAVRDLLVISAVGGVWAGGIATGGILLYRRKGPDGRETIGGNYGAASTMIILGAIATTYITTDGSDTHKSAEWTALSSVVPVVKSINEPIVNDIQIIQSETAAGIATMAQSFVDNYVAAEKYYDKLAIDVENVTHLIRQPVEGDVVVLHVSDRHDNILMDKVARAIGDAGGASIVLSTGDDTSAGEEWEAFSPNSLDATFQGYDKIVSLGNHDQGSFIADHFENLGWKVLEGQPTQVGGITWLGDSDPRSSGFGSWRTDGDETVEEQSSRLAKIACNSVEPVTLAVHDKDTASEPLNQGCIQVAFSGHEHEQLGPRVNVGTNGEPGTDYTSASTGGAALPFALGTKLKRNAGVTLHTFNDGVYVGTQPVTITVAGELLVQPFWESPERQANNRGNLANRKVQ